MSESSSSWLHRPRFALGAVAGLLLLILAVPQIIETGPFATEPPTERGLPAVDSISDFEAQPSDSSATAADDEDWLAAESVEPVRAERGSGALDCLILPSEIVEVGSQIVGLIEAIEVDRGDEVTEGQIVVRLEAGAESAAVQTARLRASQQSAVKARRENVVLTRKRKDRGMLLFHENALSTDSREELETQARIAELEFREATEARQLASLELGQARALLARRTLRSPISGVVIDREMTVGEVVDDETILKIAQVDPLRVDVLMPASEFGRIKSGMRAALEPEAPIEATVVATVSVVDPVIDAASGTFSVRLELPNADREIPGGLHCTVKFLDD